MDRIADNYFNLAILARYYPAILDGFWVTCLVAALVTVLGLALGLLLAVMRAFGRPALNAAIVGWIDFFRTLPQLVVIVIVYFALPYAGITLSPFAATVLALGAVLSAFAAEIFTTAIQSIPRGQWDSARALGLGFLATLFLVILPQAVRIAIPLLTNRTIAIIKGTALGTAVSLPEILGSAQSAMAIAANPSPLTLAAALYLLLFLPLVIASRFIERRFTQAP
jgi:His/Glu/Gln/Arg/opine family amino acid ABC transporter permease subunit